MPEPLFQLYIDDQYGHDWATLKRQMILSDGRAIKTKILSPGVLQYARRTGDIGISSDEYKGGEPKGGQWRIHPAHVTTPTMVFRRAQPEKTPPKAIPEGLQFE